MEKSPLNILRILFKGIKLGTNSNEFYSPIWMQFHSFIQSVIHSTLLVFPTLILGDKHEDRETTGLRIHSLGCEGSVNTETYVTDPTVMLNLL